MSKATAISCIVSWMFATIVWSTPATTKGTDDVVLIVDGQAILRAAVAAPQSWIARRLESPTESEKAVDGNRPTESEVRSRIEIERAVEKVRAILRQSAIRKLNVHVTDEDLEIRRQEVLRQVLKGGGEAMKWRITLNGLRRVMDRKEDPDRVYEEEAISKIGIDAATWRQMISDAKSDPKSLQSLERLIVEPDGVIRAEDLRLSVEEDKLNLAIDAKLAEYDPRVAATLKSLQRKSPTHPSPEDVAHLFMARKEWWRSLAKDTPIECLDPTLSEAVKRIRE